MIISFLSCLNFVFFRIVRFFFFAYFLCIYHSYVSKLSQLHASPFYVIFHIKYCMGFTFLNKSILESSDPLWHMWADLWLCGTGIEWIMFL